MRLATLVQHRLGLADHVHRIPPCCRCDKTVDATMLAGFAVPWNRPIGGSAVSFWRRAALARLAAAVGERASAEESGPNKRCPVQDPN
jgi:hypothetical protein